VFNDRRLLLVYFSSTSDKVREIWGSTNNVGVSVTVGGDGLIVYDSGKDETFYNHC
jgi:hypothetical protein